MSVIPEFERRKLASSYTGTPGVDRSGQILAASVENFGAQAENVGMKKMRERSEAKDQALLNRNLIELDRDLEQELRAHENEYAQFRGDPTERASAFEAKAQKLFESKIATIPSDRVKEAFGAAGMKTVYDKYKRELDSADKNQAFLAHNDVVAGANILAAQTADVWGDPNTGINDKLKRTQELLTRSNTTLEASRAVLTNEDQQKLTKLLPEMITNAAIAGGLEKNPEQILQAAEDGAFDKIMTPEAIKKAKDDARTAIPKMQERIQFENLKATTESEFKLWTAFKAGDQTVLQQLENMPESNFTKGMKDLVLKASPDPEASAETFLNLQMKFMQMMDKKGDKAKSSTKIEDLRGFMNDVIFARTRNEITDGQADTYLKKIAQPIFDRVVQGKNRGGSPYVSGYKAIDSWAKKNKILDAEVRSAIYMDFIDMMETTANPTKDAVIDNANAAVERYVRQENPSIGLLRQVPDRILKLNGDMTNSAPVNKDDRKQVDLAGKAGAGFTTRRIKAGGKIYDEKINAQGQIVERKEVISA